MKTLIFTLVFTFQALAAGTGGTREVGLTDQEIRQKLISVAQDIKNEDILKGVNDLDDCKRNFRPPSGADNTAALTSLQSCINGKFTGKSEEQIKSISDKLNLETFNLIPSKTVKNVTDYLSKKLYKNLTGVDLDERDQAQRIKNLKFGNKKQVDQKEFFDLYKNQLAKNAIFEISRFCFVDFRWGAAPTPRADNFMGHWDDLKDFATPVDITTLSGSPRSSLLTVNDNGGPFDGSTTATTPTGTAESYQDIFKNIFGSGTTPPAPEKLDHFFSFCGQNIKKMCDDFENTLKSATGPQGRTTAVTSASPTGSPSTPASTAPTVGEKACIAKNRLTAYRNAFNASDQVYNEFVNGQGQGQSFSVALRTAVKRYERGNGANEKSLTDLTNNASHDFYEANKNESNQDAEDCARNGADDACEKFIVIGDSRENIANNTDLVYLAKKEAERARIEALIRGNQQSLNDYLDKNYPDLKAKLDSDTTGTVKNDLPKLIAARWEAKRLAMQQEIQDRLGKRQITEAEATSGGSAGGSGGAMASQAKTYARENAQNALNEKARLSQVVFFNNIIASSLELKKANGSGGFQTLGRNVGAINSEIEAARSETQQSELFQNLQSTLGRNGGSGGSSSGGLSGTESINNIDFLNEFIGIPQQQNGQSRSR